MSEAKSGYNDSAFRCAHADYVSSSRHRLRKIRLLIDVFSHPRGHAMLAQLLQIDRMDARVLVLVFDLATALFHADVHAQEDTALVGGERITQAAEGDGKVPRRITRRIEMLMEHLVRWGEHPAVPPVDAHEILVAFIPEQRETVSGHGKDVKVRPVPVRFLVGADSHLRAVCVHGAWGQDEHHTGPAGAALLPRLQLEAGEVGNEIRFPHVAAGAYGNELAFAAEIAGRALTLGKCVDVIEHERVVVKE